MYCPRKELVGAELHEKMTGIRGRMKKDRGQPVRQHVEEPGDTAVAIGS